MHDSWRTGELSVGSAFVETGRPAEALAAFEAARENFRRLVDTEPSVTHLQNDLAATYANMGILRLKSGDRDGALAE